MKPLIDLPEAHLALLIKILREVVSSSMAVYIFGSRVRTAGNKYRDIDIAIEGKEKIDPKIILTLYGKFEESSLPYLVDIVDLNNVDLQMQEEIQKTSVKII